MKTAMIVQDGTMATKSYRNPKWGSGPWDQEPDLVAWKDAKTGLTCMVNRASRGNLCGYVTVPVGSVVDGMGCDEVHSRFEVEVHGGLTVAKDRTFGFDAAHCDDFVPAMDSSLRGLEVGLEDYRDIHYMIQECTNLAHQLNEIDLQYIEDGSPALKRLELDY